jgi:hypothetical protein
MLGAALALLLVVQRATVSAPTRLRGRGGKPVAPGTGGTGSYGGSGGPRPGPTPPLTLIPNPWASTL